MRKLRIIIGHDGQYRVQELLDYEKRTKPKSIIKRLLGKKDIQVSKQWQSLNRFGYPPSSYLDMPPMTFETLLEAQSRAVQLSMAGTIYPM